MDYQFKNSQNNFTDNSLGSLISPELNHNIVFKPKLTIAIMASGEGSNFEAIYKAIQTNKLEADIALLISNNIESKAIEKAIRFGIKYEYINHRDYNSRKLFDKQILKILQDYNVEAVIMAGWMRIVTDVLINAFPDRILNIHPSLLPSFKGTNAIQKALDSGVKLTGCTVHKVINQVDSGEIIAQAAIKIDVKDNLETLTKKIQLQEHRILPASISILGQELRQ